MKKFISGLVVGIIIAVAVTAFAAAELNIVPNPFPVLVNGTKTEVEGYNINGYTFLKLADFKKVGLTVKFNETDKRIEITNESAIKPEGVSTMPIEKQPSEIETYTRDGLEITKYNGVEYVKVREANDILPKFDNLEYYISYNPTSKEISLVCRNKNLKCEKCGEKYNLNNKPPVFTSKGIFCSKCDNELTIEESTIISNIPTTIIENRGYIEYLYYINKILPLVK